MKRSKLILVYLLIVQMMILLSSCGKMNKSMQTKKSNNNEIQTNGKEMDEVNINFSEVDSKTLPQNYITYIERLKDQKGFYYFKDGEYYYLVVFAGRKSTGGYGIKVKNVILKDGIVNVTVDEIRPNPKFKVIQVLTYPYVCIKLKGDNLKFEVYDISGKAYEYINSPKGASIE